MFICSANGVFSRRRIGLYANKQTNDFSDAAKLGFGFGASWILNAPTGRRCKPNIDTHATIRKPLINAAQAPLSGLSLFMAPWCPTVVRPSVSAFVRHKLAVCLFYIIMNGDDLTRFSAAAWRHSETGHVTASALAVHWLPSASVDVVQQCRARHKNAKSLQITKKCLRPFVFSAPVI